jgi:Raf kinase inhibitor-like YbhB/YbcL family protein
MKLRIAIATLAGAALIAGSAYAQSPAPPKLPRLAPSGAKGIRVHVDATRYGHLISSDYAFCTAAPQTHAAPAPDKSPRIAWSKGPAGTKSYAVFVYDTDSPAEHREWMNQEGHMLTAAIPRKIFFHMVVVDVPAKVTVLPKGEESDARVLHGKAAPAKIGVHGANSFTQAFAANDAMKGTYYGYDGPCSPWNDENTHHYHFAVYALSVASLGLSGPFDGPAALAAMKGKVLAQGQLVALYSTNPAVLSKLKK